MNISIKATGHTLSLETRELVESKFAKLGKLVGEGAQLSCEIEESIAAVRAGARYRAEGNLSVGGQLYRAEALGDTLEGAVDRARDELLSELRKSRGKERGFAKRGGAALKRLLRLGR
ncbi:MAG: HPF/RaiA family ribosome-associated protein [bacterium]|nr:HPF/RaiA family ribosome-associated protein [bacterium]